MRVIPLTLAGLLLATAALAQTTPPAPPPIGLDADAPPPHGPRGDRPPPPPRGASIRIEKGQDGAMRLDVHCAERDTTKDCAEIAMQLADRTNAAPTRK